MHAKRLSFKKNFGRIVIGLIFLTFLSAVYFFSALYFERMVLAKKTFKDGDTQMIPTPSTISQKVGEKMNSFYSFFFDLPEAVSSPEMLEGTKDYTLYLGAFSYTLALVDLTKTSLSFEGVSNAITFKPDYHWETPEPQLLVQHEDKFDKYKINSFDGPYDDKRCLDNNCLEVKGNKILYNAKVLALPSGIKAKDIHAISLGNVGSKWLVGFTLKRNGYEGEVFYFDGIKFSKIPNLKTISSQYPGLFGFGGIESDFLVIFGAYQGQAVRVQGEKISNLDKFFSYRVMNKGFKPEIIRAQSDNYINWYIYSSTKDNPHFLKLWEDGNGEVAGIISLLADLKITDPAAEFQLVEAAPDHVSLVAKVKGNGYESWHLFEDYGFINDSTKKLVSLPTIYDSNISPIYIQKINENSVYVDDEGKKLVKIEFSLDGSHWQELQFGKNIDFVQKATDRYFLRVTFLSPGNKFYSPYVDKIVFSYLYNK